MGVCPNKENGLSMACVLVTGAAGLLGTELCLQLRTAKYEVIGVDNLSRYTLLGEAGVRDQITNAKALMAAGVQFRQEDFRHVGVGGADAVVHAAAQVCHSRKGKFDNPSDDVQTNIVGTVDLLEQARVAKLPLLFISSAKVYGENVDRQPQPTDESCPLGDQTHLTFFGASKVAADLFAQMYAIKYETPVGVFRPGCFTGQWALATEAQNFFGWLVHCALKRHKYNVFGDGEQVRDHLDVRDLAAACIKWIGRPTSGVWNVGGGPSNAESLNVSIHRVETLTGTKVSKVFCRPRLGDIRSLVLNSRKLSDDYNWAPKYSLTEIVEELISCAA